MQRALQAWRRLASLQPALQTQSYATGEIGLAGGAPANIYNRKVIIYTPSRSPEQQGLAKTVDKPGKMPPWKMEFEIQAKWENPLMGWTSTADQLDHVGRSAMIFWTKEECISFAEKHGWNYEVREPHLRSTIRSKRYPGYGDNFSTKRGGVPVGGLKSETQAEPKKKSKKSS